MASVRSRLPSCEDSGLLLRSVPHGDSGAIATYLTRQRGKQALLLRGGRASSRRMPLALEPFHTLSLRYEQGRGELGTLLSAELWTPRLPIGRALEASFAAGAYLRWLSALSLPEQGEPWLFDAACAHLDELADALAFGGESSAAEQALAWQLRGGITLLAHAGYALQLAACAVCGRSRPPGRSAWTHGELGGVVCRACETTSSHGARAVSQPMPAVLLDWLHAAGQGTPLAAALPARELERARALLDALFAHHVGLHASRG